MAPFDSSSLKAPERPAAGTANNAGHGDQSFGQIVVEYETSGAAAGQAHPAVLFTPDREYKRRIGGLIDGDHFVGLTGKHP